MSDKFYNKNLIKFNKFFYFIYILFWSNNYF